MFSLDERECRLSGLELRKIFKLSYLTCKFSDSAKFVLNLILTAHFSKHLSLIGL